MAFFVYQGGEPADAVRWIYDGLPIVTANDQIASHSDHVYLCRVYYWDGSWEELGTLQSRGNKLNYGVFDVQTLALSGNPYTFGALQTMDIESTYHEPGTPVTYAGREWYVRCELGWKSSTQIPTYPTNRYYRVIPGALTTAFEPVADTDTSQYVFKNNQGFFMSRRYRVQNLTEVDLYEHDRYSVTFLACTPRTGVTDTTYASTVDRVRVRVFFGDGAGVETDTFDVTLENVAVALAPTTPQTANGLLLRELSFGPKDLVSLTDGSTAVYGGNTRGKILNGTWDKIELSLLDTSNNVLGFGLDGAVVRINNAAKKSTDLCKSQMQLKFRNRLGGFDYVSTSMYVKQRMNVTRETYSANRLNFDQANNVVNLELNDVHQFSNRSNATLVDDVFTVSTGYIAEDHNFLIAELLQSNEVYARKWRSNKGGVDQVGDFYPCNIVSTDMSYMFREADKLIEYKFDIEYSNKPRPLV